jgi:cytochrome d ubiquinol oxidase subunit I
MIALTLAMYVTMYLALIVAYVGVLTYMAEKSEPAPDSNGTPTPQGATA